MAADALFVVVALVVGVGSGLLLYALVRAERENRRSMSREEAERAVRRDTDDDGRAE